jgi:hypothetical protein
MSIPVHFDDVENHRHGAKAAFMILHTPAAATIPTGTGPARQRQMQQSPNRTAHIDALLDRYVLGRLGSGMDREIETHLLVCDRCFAALVAEVVIGPRTESVPAPA